MIHCLVHGLHCQLMLHPDFFFGSIKLHLHRQKSVQKSSVIMGLTAVEEHATGSFIPFPLFAVPLIISCFRTACVLFSGSVFHSVERKMIHRKQLCENLSSIYNKKHCYDYNCYSSGNKCCRDVSCLLPWNKTLILIY